MEYNVDYFIDKFEKIPEDMFCTGTYSDGGAKHCALGWCGVTDNSNFNNHESFALRMLFANSRVPFTEYVSVVGVNDGLCSLYQQETPKQRILAALRDIKINHPDK